MVELGIIPAVLIFAFVISFAFSILYAFKVSEDEFE